MSHREVDRLGVIQAVVARRMTQEQAGRQLGLSVRQIKRLARRFREAGPNGLVSRRRGRPSNNRIADDVRQAALSLVRAHYADFGPTLACEKLADRHDLDLSAETLRQWMIADGLWEPRTRRKARIHQRRARRPCLGELVQIDGSPHDWFEGRAPWCTLLVFIDDATGRLMALRFAPAETTQAYMETLRDYLATHGRPVALYSDKHSIFRNSQPGSESRISEFTRALKTLDIEPIHANTPQAKGRVERANQTLQDRLVKELRLQGISDIESANAFLPSFLDDHNRKFAVQPQNDTDAHRLVLHSPEEIDQILSRQVTRVLSKNLTFQFRNREYQLTGQGNGYRLRRTRVTVCLATNDDVTVLHQGQALPYRVLSEGEPLIPVDDEKSVHQTVDQAQARQTATPAYRPPPDHPWRSFKLKGSRPDPGAR